MSRSKKKNAVVSFGGGSKKDRRKANKDLRRSSKHALQNIAMNFGDDDCDYFVDELEDLSTVKGLHSNKQRVYESEDNYEKALRK